MGTVDVIEAPKQAHFTGIRFDKYSGRIIVDWDNGRHESERVFDPRTSCEVITALSLLVKRIQLESYNGEI